MPHYRIRPGYQFRDLDGGVKGGGELVELGEDTAALHAEKIEPEPVDPNAIDQPE